MKKEWLKTFKSFRIFLNSLNVLNGLNRLNERPVKKIYSRCHANVSH